MKLRSQILSPSVVRSIVAVCATIFVGGAPVAQAGLNIWTSHGPGGGNLGVGALAIYPTMPSTLYAGTQGAGVFKSTDSGGTWSAANRSLPGNVAALVIDPITRSTLYAGTEYCTADLCDAGAVFKSTDSGDTWTNTGLPAAYVYSLAIDPSTPSTLYAGTSAGVFKSTDSGGTWSTLGLEDGISALIVIDPTTPSTLYAATYWEGMFKSTDSGVTWNTTGPGYGVSALAIDPKTPSTLYAGTGLCYPGGCEPERLFKSTDSGGTWSTTLKDGVGALAIDPTTFGTLYAATYYEGVLKSTDSGATWSPMHTGLTSTSVNGLAIDPTTPSMLYAGTSAGVFSIQQVAACTGDCDAGGTVTVDELITLVNIALGNAQPSACPNNIPSGAEVDITLIIFSAWEN